MAPTPIRDTGGTGDALHPAGTPRHREPPDAPDAVRFFEREGADARAALERLREDLVDGGANVELLVSDDRADLYLLVVRGGGPEPALDRATRRWRFRTASA
ncbi:MAG: hypothetical protein O3A02_00040 [bacterium]|nr:hypothetical protein [bacterium]